MTTLTELTPAELTAAAQRRLERWLLSPDLRDHMEHGKTSRKKKTATGPYIAISREAGSGGTEIALEVARRLGFDVLDKELLDFMAERYKLPRDMLDVVDETRANWFHDVLGVFFDSRLVSQDAYVAHLHRLVYLAALHGNVVFVGRAANFILPRQSGLSVRIIAPKPQRVEYVLQRRNLQQATAARLVDDLDGARTEFCRRHFHRDVRDPLEYDLVINTARLAVPAAAQLIVEAFASVPRTCHSPAGQPAKSR
ncbi:MAG: cytidylate kinase-like family protein [Pirellulaceae bacterium]|jgi:cytidylate kinase|nr:cytidylate kinase-like family protein [Pirellulaceae bacterium]